MPSVPATKAAFLAALTTALSTRVVTRNFVDFAARRDDDLRAGVVTLIGMGEKDYLNTLGRLAQAGTLPAMLIGQIRVAEDAAPSALEDAEDALAEEIKAFCQNPGDAALGGLTLLSWRQSGQIEFPYGWIVVEVEVLT